MEDRFDALIDSFIDNGIGIAPAFLPQSLTTALRQNLQSLYEGSRMQQAGTGNKALAHMDAAYRSDKIYWLDRSHGAADENAFFDLLDAFILRLNATCYAGITGYEFHYAMYEEGSFYKKHIDQFRSDDSRKFSMIMYLNADWQEGDGGELCVYPEAGRTLITPLGGKAVFFPSSTLPHEVLLSHAPRMSVTGWLVR